MFQLLIKQVAEKQLAKLDRKVRARIWKEIECLLDNPFLGKKLDGDLQKLYSLRVGSYRVLYEIHKKQVIVVVMSIGHRQGVYK